MVDVFRDSGFEAAVRSKPGELIITMPTELERGSATTLRRARRGCRRCRCGAGSRPRAVAVVGASARAGSVGGAILRNVLAAGFTRRRAPGQPPRRSA